MTDAFQVIRERVPAIEAAQHYRLSFDPTGKKARCIFHDDHRPSMSFRGSRFRCWSCGASGTSIDLVMELFGVSAVDAARIINRDFHLGLERAPTPESMRAERERRALAEKHRAFEAWRAEFITKLDRVYRCGHLALLRGEENAAVRYMDRAEYLADTLSYGKPTDQAQIYQERRQIQNWIDRALNN